MPVNKNIQFHNWGNIPFKQAWDKQQILLQQIIDVKLANRKLSEQEKKVTDNHLIFCEHPPVYTLGKSGDKANLLLNENELGLGNIEYFKINRGGDITFHGPGQIVGYPILDLDNFKTDLHWYLRQLEEVIINTIAEYGLKGFRIDGATGVWVDDKNPRKICALGIRCSRWVTMHGWALNVNTNLDYFNNIIPCGISDKGVTSLQKEIGQALEMEQVTALLKDNFMRLFT